MLELQENKYKELQGKGQKLVSDFTGEMGRRDDAETEKLDSWMQCYRRVKHLKVVAEAFEPVVKAFKRSRSSAGGNAGRISAQDGGESPVAASAAALRQSASAASMPGGALLAAVFETGTTKDNLLA